MAPRETDWLDQAPRLTEEATQREIDKARQAAATRELQPCFFCHNCGEDVPGANLFCDEDCRIDWQRAQDAKRRNGR